MPRWSPQPLEFDASDSKVNKESFERVLPFIEALAPDAIERLTLDLEVAALHALRVARAVNAADSRRLFARLPADLFDPAPIDRLADLARGAFHAVSQSRSAIDEEHEAQLPKSLVDEATALKDRMMRVVDYYLSDDPVAAAEIASIKCGTGYVDLASDLDRIADLYAAHKEEISADSKHYDSADESAARAAANQITELLAAARGALSRRLLDLQARLWTRLRRDYDEIAAAGRFLFRDEARLIGHFVALPTAVLQASRRAPAAGQAG